LLFRAERRLFERSEGEKKQMASYQNKPRQSNGIELFVGLGPKGADITEQAIKAKLEETGIPVLDVRKRGTAAFVDVATADQAEQVISQMNGQFIGESRLSVNLSKAAGGAPRRGGGGRGGEYNGGGARGGRGGASGGRGGGSAASYGSTGIELFVGLGPNGETISADQLTAFLSKSAPVLAVRHRGTRAFVDVATNAQAEKLINELSGQYIGEARLAIKLNGDRRPRESY
jgi:hypothetical protein